VTTNELPVARSNKGTTDSFLPVDQGQSSPEKSRLFTPDAVIHAPASFIDAGVFASQFAHRPVRATHPSASARCGAAVGRGVRRTVALKLGNTHSH